MEVNIIRILQNSILRGVTLSGGEPFLCCQDNSSVLGGVTGYLCDSYAGRFERIRIFTNGTIVPDDALCEVFSAVSRLRLFTRPCPAMLSAHSHLAQRSL